MGGLVLELHTLLGSSHSSRQNLQALPYVLVAFYSQFFLQLKRTSSNVRVPVLKDYFEGKFFVRDWLILACLLFYNYCCEFMQNLMALCIVT
jgi:hypothetical protein